MTWQATLFWLANMVCDTVGQLSFKAASLSADEADGWDHWKRLAQSPFLWIGIFAFVFEFIFFITTKGSWCRWPWVCLSAAPI